VWEGERAKKAQEKSMSVAGVVSTGPLSFKCFVAGLVFEWRMGNEH